MWRIPYVNLGAQFAEEKAELMPRIGWWVLEHCAAELELRSGSLNDRTQLRAGSSMGTKAVRNGISGQRSSFGR